MRTIKRERIWENDRKRLIDSLTTGWSSCWSCRATSSFDSCWVIIQRGKFFWFACWRKREIPQVGVYLSSSKNCIRRPFMWGISKFSDETGWVKEMIGIDGEIHLILELYFQVNKLSFFCWDLKIWWTWLSL